MEGIMRHNYTVTCMTCGKSRVITAPKLRAAIARGGYVYIGTVRQQKLYNCASCTINTIAHINAINAQNRAGV